MYHLAEDTCSADARRHDRSLTALRDPYQHHDAAFARIARQLRNAGRLGETFVDHYEVGKSFGGTILMVIEHNGEHRTEALHILQRLGLPGPPGEGSASGITCCTPPSRPWQAVLSG